MANTSIDWNTVTTEDLIATICYARVASDDFRAACTEYSKRTGSDWRKWAFIANNSRLFV